MNTENDDRLGAVKISEDIIAETALNSSKEIEGFHSFVRKGIRISHNEDGMIMDLYIKVNYGVKIPDIAWNLQEKVKKDIENLIEHKVKKVNIHVQGVHFAQED